MWWWYQNTSYHIVRNFTMLIILWIALYDIVWHCMLLYAIVWYCMILYDIVWYIKKIYIYIYMYIYYIVILWHMISCYLIDIMLSDICWYLIIVYIIYIISSHILSNLTALLYAFVLCCQHKHHGNYISSFKPSLIKISSLTSVSAVSNVVYGAHSGHGGGHL